MNTSAHAPIRSTTSLILATLATLACAAHSARAAAQSVELPAQTVRYSDLNLDSEQGARALYARLHFAALEVCAPLEARELDRKRVWQNCIDSTLDSAVRQINKPMLSAVHNPAANRPSAG